MTALAFIRPVRWKSALTALALALPLAATAVLSPATQDTHIDANAPTAPRGGWGSMLVSPTTRALVEFELAALLPAGTKAERIEKAELQLFQYYRTGIGSIEVIPLVDAFTEVSTTWSTAPRDTGPGSGQVVTLSDGVAVPVFVDVTRFVKAAVSGQQQRVRFTIRGALATPAVAVELGSKESAHAAQLDITLTAPAPVVTGPTYLSATSTGQSACASVCSAAGAIAVVNNGAVCVGRNGRSSSFEQYVASYYIPCSGTFCSGTQVPSHYECGGGGNYTASCSCQKK